MGNLIVSIAHASGTDTFGNAYPQGINVTTGTISGTTISGGTISGTTITGTTFKGTDFLVNSSGAFFYSGTPASGNLSATVTQGSGTDSFGNAFLAGETTYGFAGPSAIACQNSNSQITFYLAASQAGPYSAQGFVQGDNLGNLLLGAGTGQNVFIQTPFELFCNKLAFGTHQIVTLNDDASGYPTMTDGAGYTANLSVGQHAATNTNTIAAATFQNLSVAGITANDAAVGSVYKLTLFGYGIWGSTQQELDLVCRFGAVPGAPTDTVGTRAKIAATAFAANADFQWHAEVIAVCVTTGVSGTWQLSLSGELDETTNPLNPGTAADNAIAFAVGTGNTPVTQDTTSAINMGMSAQWASTTGAPTISKTIAFFERIS